MRDDVRTVAFTCWYATWSAVLPRSGVRRPRKVVAAVLALVVVAAAGCTGAPTEDDRGDEKPPEQVEGPFRAFTPDSWWNLPVPDDAPDHPREEQILEYMQTAEEAGDGCLRLAGARDNVWGQPVYWAEPDDPAYEIEVDLLDDTGGLRPVRIPRGARPAPSNDREMTVFDLERGHAVALTEAVYDEETDTWSASGATITYLDSNGLHVRTGRASDPRNIGSHRGNNAAVLMARIDEVTAGRIDHVLKVASGPEVSTRHVFPMVGSDGHSRHRDAPPQGLRLRLRPSLDLDALGLQPQALVIARAMQSHGIYIGDSAGATALKLEDTRTEGRGQLWEVSETALCGLPLSTRFWDVLPAGYEPPPPG